MIMRLKRKQLQSLLQIMLSITLLIIFIWRAGPRDVFTTLSSIDWRWYLPAFGLFLLNIVIRAYRWFLMVHTLDEETSLVYLIYLYFVGFFANNFIPSGFGSDLVKVMSLRQSTGRGAEALSTVLMERITGLLGSSLIAVAVLLWNFFRQVDHVDMPLGLWIIVVVISVSIPVLFLLVRWVNPFRTLQRYVPSVARLPKYDRLIDLSDTVRRYPWPILARALLVSFPFTLTLIVVQFMISRALHVNLHISVFSLFVPIIAILNLLPISFNGLGVREGVYKFLFIPIGVPAATAVAMSLAYYFFRFAAGLLGGVLYAIKNVRTLVQPSAAKHL